MGMRAVAHDTAICLAVLPVFKHEKLLSVSYSMYGITASSEDLGKVGEVNTAALYVPWDVYTTFQRTAGNAAMEANEEAYDDLFRDLLLEHGVDGSQYYGGDPVADRSETPLEQGDDGNTPGAFVGPAGIVRIISSETLLTPWGSTDTDKYALSAAWGGHVTPNMGGVGVVLFGCYRYKVDTAQLDFGFSTEAVTSGSDTFTAQERWQAFRPALGGDILRVNDMLKRQTSDSAEFLRTMMFAGDNYITAGLGSSLTINVSLKLAASYETPYDMLVS
jgi:hypothetical protein